jgi:hypothetical protein
VGDDGGGGLLLRNETKVDEVVMNKNKYVLGMPGK